LAKVVVIVACPKSVPVAPYEGTEAVYWAGWFNGAGADFAMLARETPVVRAGAWWLPMAGAATAAAIAPAASAPPSTPIFLIINAAFWLK
jgi:hypothetical protein